MDLDPDPHQSIKAFKYFNPKIYSSGMFIPVIPDPGVKTSPDPRSATLITNLESHGAARKSKKVRPGIHGLPTDYLRKKGYIHDSKARG